VPSYNLSALIQRFDRRVDTLLTGRLSSALGESILLDLLAHALADSGPVALLPAKPHRDGTRFSSNMPTQRDLDAWFELGDGSLAAVECKNWTSSSLGGVSVPDDDDAVAALANKRWSEMIIRDFKGQAWTSVNKVGLPLKPPSLLHTAAAQTARRILAFWHPISSMGLEHWSEVQWTPTWCADALRIEVFSASLYVRSLLRGGHECLPTGSMDAERLVAAIEEIVIEPADSQ
jgi:hypothetical protein